MITENYQKFLDYLNESIKGKLTIHGTIINYADWQPIIIFNLEDICDNYENVISSYKAEYNELNESDNGNVYDIISDYYLKGERPSGCCTCKVPRSPLYDEFRAKLLPVIDEVKDLFEVHGFRFKDSFDEERWCCKKVLCVDIWNDEIDKERDFMYHYHECDFDAEREMERAAEEQYEAEWLRRNYGITD